MKKRIITGALIVALLILVIWAYRKFLYFPHAVVTAADQNGITWTNNNDVVSSKIIRGGSGESGGTYGQGMQYKVQYLPNNQFRFIVYKLGQENSPKVDNIFSFGAPPTYLTK